MASKDSIKENEVERLEAMLFLYKKVLHPDFFDQLRKQIAATYEENRREAFDNAKISDDALWIERRLKELGASLRREPGHPGLKRFFLKCFYRDLLDHFQKHLTNDHS